MLASSPQGCGEAAARLSVIPGRYCRAGTGPFPTCFPKVPGPDHCPSTAHWTGVKAWVLDSLSLSPLHKTGMH